MNNYKRNRQKNKGYSLIELAIVIVIIAVIFSLLYKYYPRSNQVQQRIVQTFNTEFIDDAMVGFAYANGRLPFPDSDLDGIENLNATRGTVPERTLGLSEKPVNRSNIPFVYSLFNKVDTTPSNDMALGESKDRLYALLPNGIRSAAPIGLNQSNTIDFCFALKTAANISLYESGELHVSRTILPIYNKNVAYVVVDPGRADADGDGNLLDGFNSSGIKFEVATKAQSPVYDDRVNSVEFSELFGSLACGSVISAALHAHDNVVLAADMMITSFQDYENLLDLTEQLAEADVVLAAASILQAAAGIADTVAGAATAVAESLTPPLTAIGAPAAVAIAAAAILATASTVAAAVTTAFAADALSSINKATNCFEMGTQCEVGSGNFVFKATELRNTIRTNAIAADAAGL